MSDSVSLSVEQREIKLAIEEDYSCFVNAVPGAGKTTLALHIAKELPDRKILLLTFSSDLKTDARLKMKRMGLRNLDIHSYNSLPRKLYDKNASQDEDIYNILRYQIQPRLTKQYDLIILDETQDMTHLHYKFIIKVIDDLQINPSYLIIGDEKQAVFQFKGADSRFLTLSPKLFNGNFKEYKLSVSFRLTDPMSQFMNDVVLNEERIKTNKKGKPVKYIIDDTYSVEFKDYIYKTIKDLINNRGYKYDDFFILAPTLKRGAVNQLDSYLADKPINGKKIDIYRPPGDDGSINEEHMKGKITMTTFHRSKGRERKCVFVLGCDESYYKIYTDMYDNPEECVEPLYVALTRATERLHIIHDINRKKLPFIRMDLSELYKKSYCQVLNRNKCILNRIGDDFKKEKTLEYSVTQITRYISQKNETELIPILDILYTKISEEKGIVPVSNEIFVKSLTENVSDLNGEAIPALWEYIKTGNNSLLDKYRRELVRRQEKNVNNVFTRSLKRLKLECNEISDFLLLSNLGKSIDLGIQSNLNQIEIYDWIKPHVIERSLKRLNDYITEEDLQFEVRVERNYKYKGDSIYIRGYIDILSPNSVYELKCTESLNISHKIQLIFYAWLYKEDFDEPRKFYLFNMKSNESYELDSQNPLIDKVIDIIFQDKLSIKEKLNDEEFIKHCSENIDFIDIPNMKSKLKNESLLEDTYLIVDSEEED